MTRQLRRLEREWWVGEACFEGSRASRGAAWTGTWMRRCHSSCIHHGGSLPPAQAAARLAAEWPQESEVTRWVLQQRLSSQTTARSPQAPSKLWLPAAQSGPPLTARDAEDIAVLCTQGTGRCALTSLRLPRQSLGPQGATAWAAHAQQWV